MKYLTRLKESIITRVNVSLEEFGFDVGPYVRRIIKPQHYTDFYAFYGLTTQHPHLFQFSNSSIVKYAILYKSDIRGDELKSRQDPCVIAGRPVRLHDDEVIDISDSFLIKTLVHNKSHDPTSPERFSIANTVSMHYANIHGAPSRGCCLFPFATVDLTTMHESIVGAYAYVQVGEFSHMNIQPGQIWIRSNDDFDFNYVYDPDVLKKYIRVVPGKKPSGAFMDFVEERKTDFVRVFGFLYATEPDVIPRGSFISRYCVLRGNTHVDENVLVAQRSYLENAWLGKGANAQENCYIINSRLEGFNVTAHGGKIIHSRLGKHVFVGFNSFLRGSEKNPLVVGQGSIVMPHTIMDLDEPLEVPAEHVVWGYVRNQDDLRTNSVAISDLIKVDGELKRGAMTFRGSGDCFIKAFLNRIHHILEANGAYFNGSSNHGHAQKTQNISYNIIQPYSDGDYKGIYPTILINPMPPSGRNW